MSHEQVGLDNGELIEKEDVLARAKVKLIEEYGVRFIESKAPNFGDLDYATYAREGIDPDFVKTILTEIIEYLSWPIVEDTIVDHNDRRSWKKELYADPRYGKSFSELLERNKRRINRIGGLSMSFQILTEEARAAGASKEFIEALRGVYDILPNAQTAVAYRHASLGEKEKQIAEICKKLEQFINLFVPAKKVQYAQAS